MLTTHAQIACVVFCKSINLYDVMFLINAIDCSSVDIPPNEISVEQIIAFEEIEMDKFETPKQPFVISKIPEMIEEESCLSTPKKLSKLTSGENAFMFSKICKIIKATITIPPTKSIEKMLSFTDEDKIFSSLLLFKFGVKLLSSLTVLFL